jgi:hypothetical protein
MDTLEILTVDLSVRQQKKVAFSKIVSVHILSFNFSSETPTSWP